MKGPIGNKISIKVSELKKTQGKKLNVWLKMTDSDFFFKFMKTAFVSIRDARERHCRKHSVRKSTTIFLTPTPQALSNTTGWSQIKS